MDNASAASSQEVMGTLYQKITRHGKERVTDMAQQAKNQPHGGCISWLDMAQGDINVGLASHKHERLSNYIETDKQKHQKTNFYNDKWLLNAPEWLLIGSRAAKASPSRPRPESSSKMKPEWAKKAQDRSRESTKRQKEPRPGSQEQKRPSEEHLKGQTQTMENTCLLGRFSHY